MSRRRLIGVAVCALLAGCGGSSEPQRAPPKPQAPTPTATPKPAVGAVGAPSVAFGAWGAAEQRLVRTVDTICRNVGPIKPPSASTPLDARKAEMAREIRGLERLTSWLDGLIPPTRRQDRLLRRYVARVEAQIRLDRRIGAAAAAGDEQSVAVGMSQNAHNRAARNAVVRELGLSSCLRAREPT